LSSFIGGLEQRRLSALRFKSTLHLPLPDPEAATGIGAPESGPSAQVAID
jgi:hypothetical protein